MLRTLDQHVEAIAAYLPGGDLFAGKSVPTTNFYKLLKGTAYSFLTADGFIDAYRRESIPSQTVQYIDEWEVAVGIPDDCFPGSGSVEVRRTHVLIKLASLGAQTVADMQAVVDLFTTSFTITNAVDDRPVGSAFPLTFPLVLSPPPTIDDRFTVIIKSSASLGAVFPVTFPIVFTVDTDVVIAKCLMEKIIPVNCVVELRSI